MSESSSIEITAPDIESAIAKGVVELGVSRDDVLVDILQYPSSGLLGLGTRQAKVRLTIIGGRRLPPRAESETPAPSVVAATPAAPSPAPAAVRPTPKPAAPKPAPARPAAKPAKPAHEDEFDDDDWEPQPGVSESELADEAKVGAETLRQLLHHLHIDAKVIARPAETDGNEPPHWTLEIQGRELGALIGRRGETLSALQYITRLIASKGMERRANIVIDVEGYKSRRETMLKRLAKRMAEQAVQRGRTVQLEPMPPHERRIIHLALRDNPDVRTESIGDGEHRKVTIIPKKEKSS